MMIASIRRRAARTALERARTATATASTPQGTNGCAIASPAIYRTFTTRRTRVVGAATKTVTSTSIGALSPWTLRAAAPMATKAPAPTPNKAMRDDFLNASSAMYLDALEDQYRADPKSVPESWAALLRQLGACVV